MSGEHEQSGSGGSAKGQVMIRGERQSRAREVRIAEKPGSQGILNSLRLLNSKDLDALRCSQP